MAKDPRSMTSRGKPGSGLATGAARLKQAAVVKKAKQATGAKPEGYLKKKPPMGTNGAKNTHRKKSSSGDAVPGKTSYSYRGR